MLNRTTVPVHGLIHLSFSMWSQYLTLVEWGCPHKGSSVCLRGGTSGCAHTSWAAVFQHPFWSVSGWKAGSSTEGFIANMHFRMLPCCDVAMQMSVHGLYPPCAGGWPVCGSTPGSGLCLPWQGSQRRAWWSLAKGSGSWSTAPWACSVEECWWEESSAHWETHNRIVRLTKWKAKNLWH